MLLDKNYRKFTAHLSEAIVTDNVDCSGEYQDTNRTLITHAVFVLEIKTTAAVTLIPAPADNTYRLVEEIHMHNADTIAHHITIALEDNGYPYHSVYLTLNPNQSAHYGPHWGWSVY